MLKAPDPIPDEKNLSKDVLASRLSEEVQAHHSLQKSYADLQERTEFLEEQINWFKKQLFARSSEKMSSDDINILQGSLFN